MVCLDTSFLIDIIKGKPLNKELNSLLDERWTLTIASPTILELFKGIYLNKNLKYSSNEERDRINEILLSITILDLDKESAIMAGKIEADLINHGKEIDIVDVMIGAICIKNNETIITRNKKHFEKIPNLKLRTY